MQRLKVAHIGALRLLLRVPGWHNTSELFVLMFSFMSRLDKSENHVVEALISPTDSLLV